MFNKAYIICFDKGGLLDRFDYNQFHNTLITAKGVLNWWHYLEGTYIIITPFDITSQNVADFVKQHLPVNKHFFVSQIQLGNQNGILPKEAWDWINTALATSYTG